MKLPTLLALSILAAPWLARAGLVMEIQSGGAKAPPSVLYIDGSRLRIVEPAKEGEPAQGVMLFDGATRTMTRLDPARRTYVQFTAEDLRALLEAARERAKEAAAQARELLAQLPPEERRKAEELLAKADEPVRPARAPRPRYEKTGKTGSAAGHACDWYRQFEDGRAEGEACFAPLPRLGLTLDDFRVFEAMTAMYAAAGEGAGEPLDFAKVLSQAPGFPVIGMKEQDGRLEEEMRLVRLERRALAASLFAVPAGYQREEEPGLSGSGTAAGAAPKGAAPAAKARGAKGSKASEEPKR